MEQKKPIKKVKSTKKTKAVKEPVVTSKTEIVDSSLLSKANKTPLKENKEKAIDEKWAYLVICLLVFGIMGFFSYYRFKNYYVSIGIGVVGGLVGAAIFVFYSKKKTTVVKADLSQENSFKELLTQTMENYLLLGKVRPALEKGAQMMRPSGFKDKLIMSFKNQGQSGVGGTLANLNLTSEGKAIALMLTAAYYQDSFSTLDEKDIVEYLSQSEMKKSNKKKLSINGIEMIQILFFGSVVIYYFILCLRTI